MVGIYHVAVAVEDLAGAITWAVGKLGCALVEERETLGRRSVMKSAVLRLGGTVMVLEQGTNENSQVSQFVHRHGPGVQHIALPVRDTGQAITALERRELY